MNFAWKAAVNSQVELNTAINVSMDRNALGKARFDFGTQEIHWGNLDFPMETVTG